MSNRHTFARLSFAAIIAIIGLSVSMVARAQNEENGVSSSTEPAGMGTIFVEQKYSDATISGSWTLLLPTFEERNGVSPSFSVQNIPSGSYTIIATPPNGTTVTIRAFDGLQEIAYAPRPQLTFKLAAGQSIGIVIQYTLTHVGIVSVQSDPSGVSFEMTGPNNIKESGMTPASYENYPIGQYSVKYFPPEDCGKPAPKTAQLVEKGRASFNISLACTSAEVMRSKEEMKDDKYVVISVDGREVMLSDVPQDSWFASFVYNAARRNVLGGYKDESGEPNGLFGPGNNVTIAELAKIAHRLGGVSEESFGVVRPENPAAAGQWFSNFIASSEWRGWLVYQDTTIDPLRPATRAEVIATFLQALDVPLKWQKGRMFRDVGLRTRYAAAIETAAGAGIVSGRTGENGEALNLFAPEEPINRAEIAKIIQKVFEVYKGID